jgi:hypothetical protein
MQHPRKPSRKLNQIQEHNQDQDYIQGNPSVLVPKSFSLINHDKYTESAVPHEVKQMLKTIRDLTLSLKMETRDHKITKMELEELKKAHDEQGGEMHKDL